MYYLKTITETIRIPPERLGEELDDISSEIAAHIFENSVIQGSYFVVMITNINRVGEGRVLPGNAGVFQDVEFDTLLFRPELHEVIYGEVREIMKFGAFVRIGPLDGLLHISQIIDDKVDADLTNRRLIAHETKRDLKIGDRVRARIVAVSISERSPEESKIGLTMRQAGLGKLDWLDEDRKGDTSAEPAAGPKLKKKRK